MNRFGAVFWLILVLVSGFVTFKAKYGIQDLEDELAKVRKQTAAEQQEIRVLTAEWTFLNQPERLAELNKRFLNLVPVAARQLQQRIEDIPLRTPPAAPVPKDLDELVAAATGDTPDLPVTAVAAVVPAPVPMETPAPSAPTPVAAPAPSATPKPVIVAAAAAAPPKMAAATAAPAAGASAADAATAPAPAAAPAPAHGVMQRLAIVAAASAAPLPAPPKAAAAPAPRPAARVQLAKASPASLDALIAKIVEVR